MTRTSIITLTSLFLVRLGSTAFANAYRNVVLADNPTLYWNFDEASGNAVDLVQGATLAPMNGATRSASMTTLTGVGLGNAASLVGPNQTFGNAALGLGSSDTSWIVEFWVQQTVNSQAYFWNAGANQPAGIYGFNPSAAELYNLGANRTGASGPSTLSDLGWHHVVMGFHEGGATDTHTFIYDGGTPQEFTSVNNVTIDMDSFWAGSAASAAQGMTGLLDELAIYELGNSLTKGQFDAALANIASHANVVVPEPSTALLLTLGTVGLLARRRRVAGSPAGARRKLRKA